MDNSEKLESQNVNGKLPGWGMLLWLFLALLPLSALLVGAVIAVPLLILNLLGADFLKMLLTGLAGLAFITLYIGSLIGFIRQWYFAWVMATAATLLASFLLGLIIVVSLFNMPLNVLFLAALTALFILLRISLMCFTTLNLRDIKDRFSVVKYSHY